jgi:undecaprenyl-diphosphatase
VIGGGKLVNLALKGTFDRARPEWGDIVRGSIETFAFPSGHAMMSLLVYGYLAVILWRMLPTRNMQVGLAIGTVVLVGMIGLSRVALGRHYPSDVFAGYSMGGAWLSLCLAGRMLIDDIRRVRAPRPDPVVARPEEKIVYETNRSIDQRR